MLIRLQIRAAIHTLVTSRLRTVLALLSIAVGVAAIVALMSASLMATAEAVKSFNALGTRLIAVSWSAAYGAGKEGNTPKTLSDARDAAKRFVAVRHVAPYINQYFMVFYPGHSRYSDVLGVTPDFFPVVRAHLDRGRLISPLDGHQAVCVVGHAIAAAYRQQGVGVLGRWLRIGQRFYRVVGVLSPWPDNVLLYFDLNHAVVIPWGAARDAGTAQLSGMVLQMMEGASVAAVKRSVQHAFAKDWPSLRTQFRDPAQLVALARSQRQTMDQLFLAIAGLSIIVGGMGVANMMLARVHERRREIGVRMAIGATPWHIISMFLIEAMMLTLAAGVVGVLLGVLAAWLVAAKAGWVFMLYSRPMIIGVVVAVLLGLASAGYPAYQAAQLQPRGLL